MDSFREQFEKHVTHDSIKENGIRLHYVFTGKEDAPPSFSCTAFRKAG
ncbi:hypothetical protein LJD22_07600 [Bacillus velezensis]|nr:hypothetical protein [Bacillus velezensis]